MTIRGAGDGGFYLSLSLCLPKEGNKRMVASGSQTGEGGEAKGRVVGE